MPSANLLALRNAILTNTLTPEQQGPLANALAAIAPLFPDPDAIASIAPIAADLSDEWFAVLYAINAGGSSGILPLIEGVVYAPTASVLALSEVTGLPNGQLAIVASFGAEFALSPLGALAVDGVTVIGSPDPARVWQRGDTLVAEAAAIQPAWFVDGQNDSGHADDENNGATALTPFVHVAEIARRMGTWSPELVGVDVTITYLSKSAANDPSLFAPVFLANGRLTQTGELGAPALVGTLGTVTAKNPPTNQPWTTTFVPSSGAVAARMLLINGITGGRAIAEFDTGGGVWQVTQPFLQYGGGNPASSLEDFWLDADPIQGFVLTAVDVGKQGGRSVEVNSDFGPSHLLTTLEVFDPSGADPIFVEQESAPLMVDCVCQRDIVVSGGATEFGCFFLGVDAVGQLFASSNRFNSPEFRGGVIEGTISAPQGVVLSGDVTILGTTNLGNAQIADGVFVGASVILEFVSGHLEQSFAPIYGPGQADSSGRWEYAGPASTNFPIAGGLTIGGSTVAYSVVTALSGVVSTFGAIPITAAALDAPASSTGFGGLAFVPSSGCFQDQNAAP